MSGSLVLLTGREKEFQTSSQSSLECLPRTQSAASANSPRILRESRFHQGELQSITALFLLAGSSGRTEISKPIICNIILTNL